MPLVNEFIQLDCIELSLDRRCGVEVKRSPLMRDIRVRTPVATDLSRIY